MCVYIYIYTSIYVYTYTSIYIYTYTYISIHTYIYMYTYMCARSGPARSAPHPEPLTLNPKT